MYIGNGYIDGAELDKFLREFVATIKQQSCENKLKSLTSDNKSEEESDYDGQVSLSSYH